VIANISRISQFQECRRKAWNWHERRLMSTREAESLLVGGAFHKGVAVYFAEKDVEKAVVATEKEYRDRIEEQVSRGMLVLPEEQVIIERNIELSRRMVALYAEHFKTEDFQVVMPEVEFMVELPNTHHHCWFAHRLLHPDVPFQKCAGQDFPNSLLRTSETLEHYPHCVQPHFIKGKTDGIINWKKMLWLLEHKTSAMTGDIFFSRFQLDFQPTGYMYGIWKATGIRPHGFLLNVAKKPNKKALDQFNVAFEREPYLRSDVDLERFEREFILQCNDYEEAFRDGKIYMNTKSCTNYNRRCYYLDLCLRGNETPHPGEFRDRGPDYVDLSYYKLLGLPEPKVDPQLIQIVNQIEGV
jgi:hypothetical protein